MIQSIMKTSIGKILLGVLIGGLAVYFLSYSKITIKDLKIAELTKKVTELTATITSNTIIDETTIAEAGKITTKKHTSIAQKTDIKQKVEEVNKIDTVQREETKINPKFVTVMALIATQPKNGIVGYEVLVQFPIINRFGVVVGAEYNKFHSETLGKIGVSYDFH